MTQWTDQQMVDAVLRHDNRQLERCYHHCKHYFLTHARAIFMTDAIVDDIFQESIIHLWREIETRRIEFRDGHLCRWADGVPRPMSSSLLTFLMAIAKRKHWEQLRHQSPMLLTDDPSTLDQGRYADQPADDGADDDERRRRIVADAVLAMSERCRQILTLFYYEHRTLDEILLIRPENSSKVGLKTSKYKCMQRLRQTVRQQFTRLHLQP